MTRAPRPSDVRLTETQRGVVCEAAATEIDRRNFVLYRFDTSDTRRWMEGKVSGFVRAMGRAWPADYDHMYAVLGRLVRRYGR